MTQTSNLISDKLHFLKSFFVMVASDSVPIDVPHVFVSVLVKVIPLFYCGVMFTSSSKNRRWVNRVEGFQRLIVTD